MLINPDTAGTEKAQDCTILVVAPHATETWESSVAEEIRNSKAPILCVVTKMLVIFVIAPFTCERLSSHATGICSIGIRECSMILKNLLE